MTEEDMESVEDSFAKAASSAKRAGSDSDHFTIYNPAKEKTLLPEA